MKDLTNRIDVRPVIHPGAVNDTTSKVGQIIDINGFYSLTYVIATGDIDDADASFVVLLEHSDHADMSDAWAVGDDELLGTEVLASFRYDNDLETRKLGYIGPKRYTRLTITPVANSASATFAAFAVLGHPAKS